MLDSDMDPISGSVSESAERNEIGAQKLKRYSQYLSFRRYKPGGGADLDALMNGQIKKKLQIIPQNLKSVLKIFLFFLIHIFNYCCLLNSEINLKKKKRNLFRTLKLYDI